MTQMKKDALNEYEEALDRHKDNPTVRTIIDLSRKHATLCAVWPEIGHVCVSYLSTRTQYTDHYKGGT